MKLLLACAPLVLSACAIFSPVPDTRTPADHANELAPRCKGVADDAAVLSPLLVDRVEPAYSYANGGPNGREAHLRGARVHLRPTQGLTREMLARTLECHEARVTLGTSTALMNDPWVLPGVWLDIDVGAESDGFVAAALTDDLDAAKRVLDRARTFAAPPR